MSYLLLPIHVYQVTMIILVHLLLKNWSGLSLKDKHMSKAWYLPSRRQVIGVIPVYCCILEIPGKHFQQ